MNMNEPTAPSLTSILDQYQAGERGLPTYDELRVIERDAAPVQGAVGNPRDWLMDGSLIYRLGDDGANCDEINVAMVHGSRGALEREAAAAGLLCLICESDSKAAPAAPSKQTRPTVKQLAAQLDDDKPWTRAEQDSFAVFLSRFPNESSQGIISLGDAWKAGRAFEAAAAPLPAQPDPLATITLGGIEGDELGNIDIEIIDMKRLEALQYQMVRTEHPIYLHLYAAAPAAPLPELTGPSIGDDPEFVGRVIAAASAVMDGDTSGEWQRFAAYIDSRLAASPSPAPAPTEPQHDIEARTERIRLSHANADSKGKIQLRREVEWLLAHIALLRSPQNGLVLPFVAAPVSQQDGAAPDELQTWPQRIWLQHQFEYVPSFEVATRVCSEISWCQDNVEQFDIEYVRADLCSPASRMGGIASKACDFCEGAGGWGSGEDAEGCTKCNGTGKESAETAAPGASTEDKQ